MKYFDFFVQLVGVLGITASILSFQCRKHYAIITFRTANELLFAVQYFFLGAYTGMAMNLIGCVRNTVFAEMVKRGKSTKMLCFVFSIGFVAFTAFTWSGYKSILVGFAKVVSTFAYGNPNPALVRLLILSSASCWLIYNLFVSSYAGAVCELFTLISIIIGIIRIDIPNYIKQKKQGA